MIKKVAPQVLTEGDWLASPVKVKGNTIKTNWEGLSLREIKLLQRHKKQVLVKYGIPFVPAFLIAVILSLLFGNVFEYLI